MKYTFLIASLFFLSTGINAQQVKFKKKERDGFYEEYYVLESDKKIKHGAYLKLNKPTLNSTNIWSESNLSPVNLAEYGSYRMGKKHGRWNKYYLNKNQIKYSGYFINGLRDSLWVNYFEEEGIRFLKEVSNNGQTNLEVVNLNSRISSQGLYKNDEQIGLWKYYDFDQNIIQKYDFDNDSLLYISKYNIRNKPLTFIGGEYEMLNSFYEIYNFNEVMSGIHNKLALDEGIITILFVVDEEGVVTYVKVLKDTLKNKKLLRQAMDFIEKLKHQWSPAFENGVAVESKATINFHLKKERIYGNYNEYRFGSEGLKALAFNLDIYLRYLEEDLKLSD